MLHSAVAPDTGKIERPSKQSFPYPEFTPTLPNQNLNEMDIRVIHSYSKRVSQKQTGKRVHLCTAYRRTSASGRDPLQQGYGLLQREAAYIFKETHHVLVAEPVQYRLKNLKCTFVVSPVQTHGRSLLQFPQNSIGMTNIFNF